MGKYAAFNAELDVGTCQVETAVVVVTTVVAGNANFTLTAAALTGSPVTTVVAVANNDSADTVATKAATAMNLDSDITDFCSVVANGPNIICTANVAAANDATFNLAYADDTSSGLTDDATSTNTTAGVAPVEVAGVTNFGGPSLAANTEDVTSHDSTGGYAEYVVTTLQAGEMTCDIVYDPAGSTHDATTGLIYRYENKILTYFDFIFRSTNNWTFLGYITNFEPSAPVDGGLTASVTIQITGQPTLE